MSSETELALGHIIPVLKRSSLIGGDKFPHHHLPSMSPITLGEWNQLLPLDGPQLTDDDIINIFVRTRDAVMMQNKLIEDEEKQKKQKKQSTKKMKQSNKKRHDVKRITISKDKTQQKHPELLQQQPQVKQVLPVEHLQQEREDTIDNRSPPMEACIVSDQPSIVTNDESWIAIQELKVDMMRYVQGNQSMYDMYLRKEHQFRFDTMQKPTFSTTES